MRTLKIALPLLALAGCAAPPPQLDIRNSALLSKPPVLDQITYHTALERYTVVYPEFHFHAEDGNVVAIHREIISNDSPVAFNFMSDGRIDISAEQQKKGAVFVGGWHCGPEQYHLQLRAYLIDSNHNHSNSMDYAITCPAIVP